MYILRCFWNLEGQFLIKFGLHGAREPKSLTLYWPIVVCSYQVRNGVFREPFICLGVTVSFLTDGYGRVWMYQVHWLNSCTKCICVVWAKTEGYGHASRWIVKTMQNSPFIPSLAAHPAPVGNWRRQQIQLILSSSSDFWFDPAILALAARFVGH